MHQGTTAPTTRRRGHQHHPRHATRRRLDVSSRGPAQCGPAGISCDSSLDLSLEEERLVDQRRRLGEETKITIPKVRNDDEKEEHVDVDYTSKLTLGKLEQLIEVDASPIGEPIIKDDESPSINFDLNVRRPARCGQDDGGTDDVKSEHRSSFIGDKNRSKEFNVVPDSNRFLGLVTGRKNSDKSRPRSRGSPRTSRIEVNRSPEPEHAVARARGDGNSDDETTNVEEDPELAELAKMRCPSERTEVQAEKEARRRKRCADYPGLAFGCSIFSSDTMMKFSLIKNELQNIMGNQLKRVSIV